MLTMDFLVFGDQTLNVQPFLKELNRYRGNPVLEDFLGSAYRAIRNEIDHLPRELRGKFPRLTCVDDIIFTNTKAGQCVPLEMAVTCLYQLGVFISQHPGHFDNDKTCIMGVCTGALAAAAVGCSRSALELVPVAVDAVIAAFRVGLRVMDVSRRLEPDAEGKSWLLHVPSVEGVEKAVQDFCNNSSLPDLRKPYISAYAPNSISVSGPPSSLQQLSNDIKFKELRPQTAPIYGPYHAQHLYTDDDVEEVVGSLSKHSSRQRAPAALLVAGDGTSVEDDTFSSALRAAVGQILVRQMSWPHAIEQLVKNVKAEEATSLRVSTIGTASEQFVLKVLKQTPLGECLTSQQTASRSTENKAGEGVDNGKQKLAIVGMSGRFPGAENNEAYWDLLFAGLDVHKPVPSFHWDAKTHVDPTGTKKNTSSTPFGCWLDRPELFDARFFNISPREAPQIDPAQRLALMTAYEAIEQAGIVPDATPSTRRDRVGVFFGSTANDWMETNSAQNIDTYFIPGGNRAFIPGRINYYFQFSGPSYAVDTACSSSLASIQLACSALWRGEIDTAIAGGSNVLTNPDFTAGLDRGHFLSRTGNCKTFDDSADGYCRGEGVATVILKRLEDAVADKDPILGVVASAATNHSAEAVSITRPHVGAQIDILRNILNRGATQPHEVDYVEMHGTGTQHGDATEMTSVLESFAPSPKDGQLSKRTDRPLYLGSAKANIGHGEAASGVSSLVKVLLMMQRNIIVPHCGIKTKINTKFPTDFTERNARIALEPIPWSRNSGSSKPRKVVINNFSAAGGNSALLIEDAPLRSNAASSGAPDPRTHHLVAVSAKHATSLQGNLQGLLQYLEQNPDVSLAKLSYTTTARRIHHPLRVMASGTNIGEIQKELRAAVDSNVTRPKSAPKVIFAFTGQGAHFVGMGKELYDNFSFFSTEFRRLDRLGQSMGFPPALPGIQCDNDGDFAKLGPVVIQLAGVYIQIALYKLWASWNIIPDAVVGHSLGEYPAMAAAGILSDTDAIYLVGKRAQMVRETCQPLTHSMLVVRGTVDDVRSHLQNRDEEYEVSCINSPVETVISGANEHLETLKGVLQEAGVKSTMLKVPFAFHSKQMDPLLGPLEKLAHSLSFSKPKIPFLSSVDAKFLDSADSFTPEYLTRHTRHAVNMQGAMATAVSDGFINDQTVAIEIGPHPAVLPMFKANVGSQISCFASASRGRNNFQVLAESLKGLYLKGADLCWPQYHRDFTSSHEVIPLPAYSWDLKPYWMQYVNDWSLRKGDPPLTISNSPSLESTTIHRVVEEMQNGSKTKIVVEANIARKDLSPLVQGHEVDGIPLCTPSVYGDIALTLGKYLVKKYRPDQKEDLVDVGDMTISKALILRAGATEQRLQAHAEADFDSNSVTMVFQSFDARDRLQEHARCVTRFKDRSLLEQLKSDASKVQEKIHALRNGIVSGESARFNRPMVYRAIRPLARFHDDYRAIDEILLNSNTLEAACRLSFGTVKRDGSYHTHPAVIDALTQSCGFTMNCNDATDLDKEVFMNHGWGSFQIFEPIDMDKPYVTYTQMHEGADKLWRGDVVIFQDEKVVAFFGQIAIQGVPRRVLKTILSLEAGNRSSNQQQKSAPTKQEPKPSPAAGSNTNSTPPPAEPSASGGKFTEALKIVADESGLALTDLEDNAAFADAGVDSLMCLTISARLKDELDVDLDMSALITDYPTVGELKTYMGESGDSTPATATSKSSSTAPSEQGQSPSGTLTPASSSADTSSANKVNLHRALEIVSEESGIAVDDLTDDTEFADAGIDSLLSLVIVSRLRDELEIDVQSDSLLSDCVNVADLKQYLGGEEPAEEQKTPTSSTPAPASTAAPAEEPKTSRSGNELNRKDSTSPLRRSHEASLEARKKAVEDLVQKYSKGFGEPAVSRFESDILPSDEGKVVMVTGASGSLGSHFVHQLAPRPDVKMVVCLNRIKNNTEPYTRQAKAMRDKGLRNFEELRPKLLVLQTDTSQPLLGLSKEQYTELVSSVTHVVHNAWPMSAKRQLDGFESQFQVMRNLVDFAHDVTTLRPESFKFSFTQVSSIGVVGYHKLDEYASKGHISVPEDRVDISSVLPNGYSEAKWGMELMLDETLHKHSPQRFRPMVARCGQIAGSRTHFYWPPTEHFAFLIKSSQTLDVLPQAPGKLYWTPVEDVAGSIIDISLAENVAYPVYHIDSPNGQAWSDMNQLLAKELGVSKLVPFEIWIEMVRQAPAKDNPALTLAEFFEDNYLRMSCGGLVLDVGHTLEHSETLRTLKPVSDEIVRKYILVWREIGFLKK